MAYQADPPRVAAPILDVRGNPVAGQRNILCAARVGSARSQPVLDIHPHAALPRKPGQHVAIHLAVDILGSAQEGTSMHKHKDRRGRLRRFFGTIDIQYLPLIGTVVQVLDRRYAVLGCCGQQRRVQRLGAVPGVANVGLPCQAQRAQLRGQGRLSQQGRLHVQLVSLMTSLQSGLNATASTSNSHCGLASACTTNRVEAGRAVPRKPWRTGPSSGK